VVLGRRSDRWHPRRHRFHQADQFLASTDAGVGAGAVEVVTSAVGNVACPDHPGMRDIGMMVLRSASDRHAPVDFLSPGGLRTWGDGRLMIVRTDGTLEVRTNVDVAGKKGREHLILVDAKGTRRIDCTTAKVDWAKRLVADVVMARTPWWGTTTPWPSSRITLAAQAGAGAWSTDGGAT
jgi:hypothetical protein